MTKISEIELYKQVLQAQIDFKTGRAKLLKFSVWGRENKRISAKKEQHFSSQQFFVILQK